MAKTVALFCVSFALLVSLSVVGCNNKPGKSTSKPDAGGHADHPSEGPHHGHLIELGNEEYHAEMLDDHDTGKLTIYILDAAAKKEVLVAIDAVTINAMIDGKSSQFKLTAVSATDGRASQFEIIDKKLLEALEHSEDSKARLNVTIDGKPFVGKIEHHDHDDH